MFSKLLLEITLFACASLKFLLVICLQSQPSSSEADSQQSDKSEQPEAKKPANKKPKKVYNYVDLPIDEQTHSLSKQEIDRAFEKEVSESQLHVNV